MDVLFSYYKNTINIGDRSCCPLDYFDWSFVNPCKIDLREWEKQIRSNQTHLKLGDKVAIVGGGLINRTICRLFAGFKRTFVWGAGFKNINRSDTYIKREGVQDDLTIFYYLRDYGYSPYHVPCVSCMSPLFDRSYKVQHDLVVYEHADFPIVRHQALPKKSNKSIELDEAIEFLGSANKVITNSYHGAYWATLLGKKVFVTNWFNKKIQTLKYPPTFIHELYIKNITDESVGNIYPDALKWSRHENNELYKIVKEYICSASK